MESIRKIRINSDESKAISLTASLVDEIIDKFPEYSVEDAYLTLREATLNSGHEVEV